MKTLVKRADSANNSIPIWFPAAVIIASIAGLILRIPGFDHLSGDMIDCYLPWYESVPAGQGLAVLKNYTGDYGMPYATMLLLLHYIPGPALYKIKALSVFFEYLASFAAGLLASHFFEGKNKYISFAAGFAVTLFYPALILNGAWWGQCDSIYAGFVLLAIYALFEKKHIPAFIFFGFAVTAKLQTIFIIPFLILYYYRRRNFSLLNILIIPLTVEILYIPAMLAGFSPLTPITMYFDQTREYPQMYMHYPGLWSYFWKLADYDMFHLIVTGWVAIGLALLLIMLMIKGRDLSDRAWISIAFLSSYFPVYFLPAMHERYSMIAELTAIIYAIIHPKRSWISASLLAVISWTVYQPIIMDRFPEIEKSAVWMAYVLIALTILTIYDVIKDKGNVREAKEAVSFGKITSPEKKLLGIFDRFGIFAVILTIIAIYIFSGLRALSFEHPLYLQTAIDYKNAVKTSLRTIWESAAEVRAFNVVLVPVAALIWTYCAEIMFKKNNAEPKFAGSAFLAFFLFNPFIFIYPILEKTPDPLCLILSGVGTVIYIRTKEKPALSLLSCIFYALTAALSPEYIFFGIVILAIYHLYDRGTASASKMLTVSFISVCLTILITLISALFTGSVALHMSALVTNIGLQGAVIYPISVILIIMCRKDIRFIAPALLFLFAELFDYGKFIWSLHAIHFINIPVMSVLALLLIIVIASGKVKLPKAVMPL